MEVVKINDVVTEYRSYEWNGYTPLGMIVKAQNDTDTFETKAYQFITNHRGDVLSIRDSEDNEVGSYTYDAYGNILATEGALAKANPIRYAGYYYDEETKNYYLQARYYNPANGSFLALDPHPGDDEEPLSQNGYNYAQNNPAIYTDPNGRYAQYVLMGYKHVTKLFKVKKGNKTVTKKKKVKKYKRVKLKASVIAPKISSMPRIGSALKTDEYHRIASYLTVKQLSKRRVYAKPGRYGKMFTHLKVRALHKGREGVVHYIIDIDGRITHQMWTKGTDSYFWD